MFHQFKRGDPVVHPTHGQGVIAKVYPAPVLGGGAISWHNCNDKHFLSSPRNLRLEQRKAVRNG